MLLRIFYLLCFVIPCFSFIVNPIQKPLYKPLRTLSLKMEKKDNLALIKMIRPPNIIPTFMLSFMGGWIVNPDIKILSEKRFWIAAIITQLVMSGSMVINDIYDIDVDRKNNPSRPLPSGKVSIRSASIFSGILFFSAIILGHIHFAKTKLPIIITTSICMLLLYTPIFKRIFFIKNLVCASIVSGSIAFTGLAVGLNNQFLLACIVRLVAASSMHMEILNDIRDYEGDKMSRIFTIPVIFGKMAAGFLSKTILYFGVMDALASSFYYPFWVTFGIALACSPMIKNMNMCEMNNFSKESVIKASNRTSISLFLNMLIFCYAATVVL